jgi:hypothetical protein
VIKIAACLLVLLFSAVQSFSYSPDIKVNGKVADGTNHKPLAAATIIIQGYKGMGGTMFQDSAFSDTQGKFQLVLLDSNRYSPSFFVEKNGYKTRTVMFPPLTTTTMAIDTIFMVPYTLLDSVMYVVGGAVTDTNDEGVRGAVVSIMLIRNAATIFSVKDTASQWGGYFSVKTRQQYQPLPVTVRLHVEKTGYLSADTSQTLASSTQEFVINLVLKKNPSSVLPAIRTLTKRIVLSTRTYTVSGRLVETTVRRTPGMIVIRVSPDGSARVNVQLK